MDDVPRLALSIMQPWAWLIVNGYKAVENRDWKPWNKGLKYRGPIAIHAGKTFDRDPLADLREGRHPVTGADLPIAPSPTLEGLYAGRLNGGIVGIGEVVDCITRDDDNEWFVGPYAFVIRNAQAVDFIPVKGALGFFDWRKNLVGAS